MNSKIKNTLLTGLIAFSLSSCVSYNHSYRVTEDTKKEKRDFEVKDNYLVDLKIDFKTRIKAESAHNHKGVNQASKAKEDAYFQAIVENRIDVLVDPIYKVKTVKGIFGSKSTAEVHGYKAMYGKITEVEEGSNEENSESDELTNEDKLFEMRFDNLKKLAELNDIVHEEKSVYAINSKGATCCDGKTSSNSNFGDLHLLETTKNKTPLINQYMKLINKDSKSGSLTLSNKKLSIPFFGRN